MKKRIIALSVAAALGGIAGAASAQEAYWPAAEELVFSGRGIGHILYVPYFSTQEGNVTAINIVNTDLYNGKVLKVRFRGASNSDDVYDFQVFLSPGDVWAAGISKGADGRSVLNTSDKSCTLPATVNGSFITTRLPSGADASETREGYVEILTMADVPDPAYYPGANDSTGIKALFKAIKHVKGVAPCTSSVMTALTQQDADDYMSEPTTGIMANWTIINVEKVYSYTADAVAIEARTTWGMPGYGNLVYWDQRAIPLTEEEILGDGTTSNGNTADPLIRSGAIIGARYDLPDLSTPYLPNPYYVDPNCPFCQAFDLSYAIAAYQVAGEFYSEPTVGAQTDWVISFPTRRYYAAVDYANKNKAVYNPDNPYFNPDNTEMGSSSNGGKSYQLCSRFGQGKLNFFDREETNVVEDNIVISPGTPTELSICGEVAVVGINVGASTATGGAVARANVTNGFTEGWGTLTTRNTLWDGYSYWGLPMLVRQFTRVNNTTTNVYYGWTYPARVTIPGDTY